MADANQMRRWPPNASEEYLRARENLQAAERDLLDRLKRVAELRRALPGGTVIPDYSFTEGPIDLAADEPVVTTRLADLVGDRGLVVYHLMYDGCPSCSMWIDGLHGVSHHLARLVDFVVISKTPLPRLRAWARHRGWAGLRLLSSYESTFNLDLGAEDPEGGQWPGVSVFVRRDGAVHHSYTTPMIEGGMDLLCPVWHVEDLLPQGRGDWEPDNSYAGPHRGAGRDPSR